MNIEKLQKGIIIKNYKVLCEDYLGVTPTKGNGRKYHFKELDRYCEWHKEGQKIIIDNVFESVKEKIDMRGKSDNNTPKYVDNIKLNILGELLTKGTNGKYVVGKGVLIRNVGLTNINYSYCKRRQAKLANYLEINKEVVNDYYNSVDSMLLNNLEKALKDLVNIKVIQVNGTLVLCKNIITNITYEHTTRIDEYDEEIETIKPLVQSDVIYVQATDEERNIILNVENKILEEMKEKRITDIILKGKAKQYYSRCYSELRKQIKDINFYFSAYDIVFLFDKVAKYLDDNGYEDWTKDYKNEQTDIINNEAMDKIIDNATKRQEKAIKENKGWGKNPNEKINTRSNKDYLPNYNKINSSVIDINAENIKDRVRKSKKNKK